MEKGAYPDVLKVVYEGAIETDALKAETTEIDELAIKISQSLFGQPAACVTLA